MVRESSSAEGLLSKDLSEETRGPVRCLGADQPFKPKVQAVSFPGGGAVTTALILGNVFPLSGCKIFVRFPNCY